MGRTKQLNPTPCTKEPLVRKGAGKTPRILEKQYKQLKNIERTFTEFVSKTQPRQKKPIQKVGKRQMLKPVPLQLKPSRRSNSSGTGALREIRKYQNSTELLLRGIPFARLVREISQDLGCSFRWQKDAIHALQEAAEAHLIRVFEDCQRCAVHANRVTVMKSDFALVKGFDEK